MTEKRLRSESSALAPPDRDTEIEVRVLRDGYPNVPSFEIWTERTIYEFDVNLCCIGARDFETGESKGSECIGARLLGGRHLENQEVELSAPLPGVGHSAVLSGNEEATIVTSPVTRVIMYIWRWSSAPAPTTTASNSVE